MANLPILCGQAFPDLKKTDPRRSVHSSDSVRAALVRARCISPEAALELAVTEENDVAIISCLSAHAAAATVSSIDSPAPAGASAQASPIAVQPNDVQQLTEAVHRLLTQRLITAARRASVASVYCSRLDGAMLGDVLIVVEEGTLPVSILHRLADMKSRRDEKKASGQLSDPIAPRGCVSGCQAELTIDTGAAVALMDYKLFGNLQPA